PTVRAAGPADAEACVAIVAGLADFFTASTHDEVRQVVTVGPAWLAEADGAVLGFVAVSRRYQQSAEITFAAVRSDHRGQGIGTRLVQHVMRELGHLGVTLIEVKTLDASAEYPPYVA